MPYGALEVKLGNDGARKALQNNWYNVKPGATNQLMVEYVEASWQNDNEFNHKQADKINEN